jgi:hypothetical protein
MSLEDSPKLQDDAQWMQDDNLEAPAPKKKPRSTWGIIGILIVLGAILGLLNLTRTDLAAGLSGKGSVTGTAKNEAGKPVEVEVYVLGMELETQSDENGNFRLANVPAGERIIVIAYQGLGSEYHVQVLPNEETSLGLVRVVETQIPGGE